MKIDYSRKDTSAKVFLDVLTGQYPHGNKTLKTINSGPKDNIFVYFADHGAPDLLGFSYDVLKGTDLRQVIMDSCYF